MRLLVTGTEGQVARSLLERARERAGIEVLAVGRPDLDLARPETIAPALAAARPDIVVSAAAYTAVDQAVDEPDVAHAVLAVGAGAGAGAAAAIGVPVIHLSTDYVFDGGKAGAYVEDDPTAPLGAYGRTKLEGEIAVADANPRHVILRTAWVYSPFGKNFAKTMLRLAGERDEIAVVADQWGNPTSALDIADAILHIAPAAAGASGDMFGVFHLAATGKTSWNGFARHLLGESAAAGGPSARVRDISTAEFPTKARRPSNSCLNTDKLFHAYGWRAPRWETSGTAVVKQLLGQAATIG